jgi:ATP-dependent Clp protease ATP-binding subunit ClpC
MYTESTMHDSFMTYSLRLLRKTTQAVVNLAMFIPYYFSVLPLSKTLFTPWKNVVSVEKSNSWSIQVLGQQLADNFASRLVGFMVRSSILIAFVFVQVFFVLSIPVIYLGLILTLPLSYLFYTLLPTEKDKKIAAFNNFMKRHLVDQKYQDKVLEWFEIYYQNSQSRPWWALDQLLSQPPLGRDLSFGFTNKLDEFSTEISLKRPHHKHLIGRTKELDVVQRILSKSGRANVLLVGEDGVGRNAIVEAVAKAIYEGSINQNLAYKRVIEIDIDKVLAQVDDYVKREEILSQLFAEAERAGNTIIVIKNIERYVDGDGDHTDLSKVIEKFASSDRIHFIATTTPYMFQKHIYPQRALVSLFEQVDVHEVTPQQALRILLDVVPDMEKRSGVSISYGALVEAIELAERHITNQPFPEKAIELLDEAAVYAHTHSEGKAVDDHLVRIVMEQRTHVPTEITESLRMKLLHLEEKLRERVLFQDQALHALGSTLRKAFTNLTQRRKPLASMLFLGPTGVGKTETAKAVTEAIFDSPDAMIRFDMSNFQTLGDIEKLIGSSTTNEPGQLTEAVRNQRYGTLLLDELEKAHHDLVNIFLTILDEGYFTDGFGERVDCTNLIVIATSNAGATDIYQHMTEGLSSDQMNKQLMDNLINTNTFAPEFLNRFDGVIFYKPLYKESITLIAQRLLDQIKASAFQQHKATLQFSPGFLEELVKSGYDSRFGARNMQRLIRDKVEDTLSKRILEGSIQGQTITF